MLINKKPNHLLLAGAFLSLNATTQAASLNITVEAPSNLGLAPALLAFHDGSTDFFDTGSPASAGLESLAEVGNTSVLQNSLGAGVDSITVANGGPFFPGNSNTVMFNISDSNTMLSFAAMILPSNDWFIGNNDALDISSLIGAPLGSSLVFEFGRVYDAGTELEDFAFSPGNGIIGIDTASDPGGGTAQGGNISLVSGADPFGGFANTSPGTFDSTVFDFNANGAGNTVLGRVTLTVVPEPSTLLVAYTGRLAASTSQTIKQRLPSPQKTPVPFLHQESGFFILT